MILILITLHTQENQREISTADKMIIKQTEVGQTHTETDAETVFSGSLTKIKTCNKF